MKDKNVGKNLEDLRERLRTLLDAIQDREDEFSCEECQAMLPAYVEAEIEGGNVAGRFATTSRHLLICDECGALYADLLEITMLEESGQLPVPATIPAPDLNFLPVPVTFSDFVYDVASDVLTAIASHLVKNLEVISEAFFDRISMVEETITLQRTLAETPVLGLGTEATEALRVLAATHYTTERLVTTLPPEEIEEQLAQNHLRDTVWETACTEAQAIGLNDSQTRAFADEYTDLIHSKTDVLIALSEQRWRTGESF